MAARRAYGISTLTEAAIFLINFAAIVAISRLLSPEEIGVFSVSVALLGIAHIFRDFGVGRYLIQVRDLTTAHIRAAFTVTLLFSWSIAGLLLLLRPLAAMFYSNDGISNVLGLLSLNFVLLPFGAPLRSLLARDMRFDLIAIVRLSSNSIQTATTIATALLGASYLSMAWGSLAGTVASIAVLLAINRNKSVMVPTTKGLMAVLRFGGTTSATGFTQQLGEGAPDLILGRTQGFADVAFYSRAASLTQTLLGKFLRMVQSVYLPAFARTIREGVDPASRYTQNAQVLTGFTAPALACLVLLADNLIILLFGPQWDRSASLAAWFCLYALITAPYAMTDPALTASGNVALLLRAVTLTQSVRALVLLSSVFFELETVVTLLVLFYIAEAYFMQAALQKAFGLSARSLWSGTYPAYCVASLTWLSVLLTETLLTHMGTDPYRPTYLLICVTVALFSWALSIAAIRHPLSNELYAIWSYAKTFLRQTR